MLALSLFPGLGLLDMGFESVGICIVRGPDEIWGGDIRRFHPPAGRFDMVIGGPPCQDFSGKRRAPPTGKGVAMLHEFGRCVIEAKPECWLAENVPAVPTLEIEGYTTQRLYLSVRECGGLQERNRCIQFGSRVERPLTLMPARQPANCQPSQPAVLASEGQHKARRRTWAEFCALQGLPPLKLPGMSIAGRYAAVGNGVHLAVATTLARAVCEAMLRTHTPRVCVCGCGRELRGQQQMATAACRQRMKRARDRSTAWRLSTVTVTRESVARGVTDPGA